MKTSIQYKKIKGGNLVKFQRTKKLRDDIPCSISECQICEGENNILTLNQRIILLDYSIVSEQIDALENFEIINNCIIPQSEYSFMSQKDFNLFKRFNNIIEKRNIHIFPNEFHVEINNLPDDDSLTKDQKQNLIFTNTADYLIKHIQSITNDFKFIILSTNQRKLKYSQVSQSLFDSIKSYGKPNYLSKIFNFFKNFN